MPELASSKPQQASKKTKLIARLLLVLVTLGCVVGLGELAARMLPAQPLVRFQQLDERLAGGERHQFVGLIENDSETFWRLRPGLVLPTDTKPFFGTVSNSQGYRSEQTFGPKVAGEVRVLFLGDSCIYGYGLGIKETLTHQTELRLRARFPDANISCINAGVPGYTLFQGFQQLRARGYLLEPDIVILSFGWNDGDAWDGRSDAQQYAELQASEPPAWLSGSRLGQLAAKALAKNQESSKPWPSQTRVAPKEYATLLEEIKKETHSRGIELLLLVPGSKSSVENFAKQADPAQLNLYQAEGIRLGREMSFGPYDEAAYINGVAVLAQELHQNSVNDLFLDSVHPSAIANRILARVVAHRLLPWLEENLQ